MTAKISCSSSRTIRIVVAPAPDRQGRTRYGAFEARIEGSSELLAVSTKPFIDSARRLIAIGTDPATTLELVHAAAPTTVALRAGIGVAARYDVMGGKFVRRTATASPMPSSRIATTETPGIPTPIQMASISEPGITAEQPFERRVEDSALNEV